jgi:hypothetical protein
MSHPDGQRHVAGLWCGQVLERLPDLVEGVLAPEDLARVEAHVAGCDWCERFGGAYASVVGAMRRTPPRPTDGLAERLRVLLAGLPDQDG